MVFLVCEQANRVQFSSGEEGFYALGKAHMRSAPSFRSQLIDNMLTSHIFHHVRYCSLESNAAGTTYKDLLMLFYAILVFVCLFGFSVRIYLFLTV